jgi:hypothetical protein
MSTRAAKPLKAKDKRRLVRNDLNASIDAISSVRSNTFTCAVNARVVINAISNLQFFFSKNSSSEDAILKPLLEDVKSFLGEFNQGNFSAEFCIIWKLAGRPMTLIVLQ